MIVIKGTLPELILDRSLDYAVAHDDGAAADVYVFSLKPLVRLVGEIISARRKSPLCRIVVLSPPPEENLLQALFPFLEFLTPHRVPLSDIVSGKASYRRSALRIPLSANEESILSPLSIGMSDKETAFFLGISERTVVRRKQRVLAKTGLVSSSQLSVFSALMAWIRDEEERSGAKDGRKVN